MTSLQWEGSCFRIMVCAHVVYIANIHANNTFSFLSSPFQRWADCPRCPSAILTQAWVLLLPTQWLPQWGGFPLHFPSHPHKGDPFQLLLTAPLSTFRSSLLPWGWDWLKEKNKKHYTRWMHREVRFVEKRHLKPISQWLDVVFFGNAWLEEGKLIPVPRVALFPGCVTIWENIKTSPE